MKDEYMGLVIWLLIGAAIGWAAALIRKSDKKVIRNECILAGVVGGAIGGLLINVFFPPGGIHINFTWQTTIAAALGAVIVLFVYFVFDRKYNL